MTIERSEANPLQNSRLAAIFLSPDFNFDTTANEAGVIHNGKEKKAVLIGRVKKMDQAHRSQLMDQLNWAIKLVQQTKQQAPELLVMYTLCSKVTSDDGEQAPRSNFIVACIRTIGHLFALRISSEDVAKRITLLRSEMLAERNLDDKTILLNTADYPALPDLKDLNEALEVTLASSRKYFEEISSAEGIASLQTDLAKLKEEFKKEKDKNWASCDFLGSYTLEVELFKTKINANAKIPQQLKDKLTTGISIITEYWVTRSIQRSSSNTEAAIQEVLISKLSKFLDILADSYPKYVIDRLRTKLNESTTEKQFSHVEKIIVGTYQRNRLDQLITLLDHKLSDAKQQLTILQAQEKDAQNNNSKYIAKKDTDEVLKNKKTVEKQNIEYNEITQALASLENALGKGMETFKAVLKLRAPHIYSNVKNNADLSKFGVMLNSLNALFNNPLATTNSKLEAIELLLGPDASDKAVALKAEITRRKSLADPLAESDQFVKDYFGYIKTSISEQQAKVKSELDKIREVESKSKKPDTTSTETPPPPPPPPSKTGPFPLPNLPAMNCDPKMNELVRKIHEGCTASADYDSKSDIEAAMKESSDQKVWNRIYQNFFWILVGADETKENTGDKEYGMKVFLSQSLGWFATAPKNHANKLQMNEYRVLAMAKALNGETLNGPFKAGKEEV